MKKLAAGIGIGAALTLLTLHIIQRAVVGDWPFKRR